MVVANQTFREWWFLKEQLLNKWNMTPHRIHEWERIHFILNNVGHIPRFSYLVIKFSAKTALDPEPIGSVVTQFENADEIYQRFLVNID
jgi:hypothetical protein